jgi:hypothetical protein
MWNDILQFFFVLLLNGYVQRKVNIYMIFVHSGASELHPKTSPHNIQGLGTAVTE